MTFANRFPRTSTALRFSFLTILVIAHVVTACAQTTSTQPNILWITHEDSGPQLGCYGDKFATTPNIDALATSGCLYLHAWSTAPVCSPARTALLTGMYPATTGGMHHRSLVPVPPQVPLYPKLLREAGYYCTNNSKTDYDVAAPRNLWNESSARAHWKNRPAGKPFFAVFNLTESHEGQIRTRQGTPKHDPAKVPVPAYHPDTPEVRLDWAHYYDSLTDVDTATARLISEVREAGLDNDTIIIVGSDNGIGMPRSKRSPQNSGLHVSLITYIPPALKHLAPADYKPAGRSERLVSFVDMAPTFLRLAGIAVPPEMQGSPILHDAPAQGPKYMFGERGRMDERYDLSRSVTNGRYVYIRNYLPYLPAGQFVQYMFQTPTTRVWHDKFTSGTLNAAQSAFWLPKPAEELYDLQSDPWEVANLVTTSTATPHPMLDPMRAALRKHILETRDLGFLPESEMQSNSQGKTPYEFARDPAAYPLEEILAAAEAASSGQPADLDKVRQSLTSPHAMVRRWSALGLLMRGKEAVTQNLPALRTALQDESPTVRTAAAEALAQFGNITDREPALGELLKQLATETPDGALSLEAANAISRLGTPDESLKAELTTFLQNSRSNQRKEREAGSNVHIALRALLKP